MKLVEEELGIETKTVELNYDTTKQEPVLTEFSEDDEYDIIVAGTYNLKEAVQNAAVNYPDKKYIMYDAQADHDELDLKNVYSFNYKQNEASFLAGALATKLTQSGIKNTNDDKIVGFIAGGENTTINDFLMGYIEGTQYADKDARMLISYVGDFANSAKAKEMALAQYQQKADIIFQVASRAGIGVLDAAKETSAYAIGVDTDQYELFYDTDPAKSEQIVTSVLKHVDLTLLRAVERAVEGDLPWGQHESLGIKENGVGLAKNAHYEKVVPEEIRAFIDETEKKILDGEIKVGTSIGMSTDKLNEIRNAIKP